MVVFFYSAFYSIWLRGIRGIKYETHTETMQSKCICIEYLNMIIYILSFLCTVYFFIQTKGWLGLQRLHEWSPSLETNAHAIVVGRVWNQLSIWIWNRQIVRAKRLIESEVIACYYFREDNSRHKKRKIGRRHTFTQAKGSCETRDCTPTEGNRQLTVKQDLDFDYSRKTGRIIVQR